MQFSERTGGVSHVAAGVDSREKRRYGATDAGVFWINKEAKSVSDSFV